MTVRERVPLALLTSFGVGGRARFYIEAGGFEDVRAAYTFARERSLPLKVLGAGTNVLVPDEGVDAVVVKIVATGHTCNRSASGHAELAAAAGASWDALVTLAAREGLWGIENLAGIPGSVGGALVQNIGAYGAEFAQVFAAADVLDLASGAMVRTTPHEARLNYRTSIFKERADLVILSVTLKLSTAGEPNLTYADLARAREASVPLRTPGEIAECVRAIRKEKFPDEGCAGSFFKNPVVSDRLFAELRHRLPELPGYPVVGGVKVPLAYLLDRALGLNGYAKGPVRLFERQPLVLVARTGARAKDVEEFAEEIERRVQKEFGFMLEREVETFA